ncbi:MAG: hypothetical protein KatS3mg105_2243 [Gemmatales bacterium]|nr:MAG: hypothetical protein KatS3mg105_2243 [Gemmatales bacterium]
MPRRLFQFELYLSLGWFFLCIIVSSCWCRTTASEIGAVFDEPTYLEQGLKRWRTGECKGLMRLGTMTLPVDVQTLPIYLWERYRGKPFDPEADLHQVLPVARAMTLFFWSLLLTYAWLAGRRLAGPWAGALAVALIAFEPSYLAHASLATTDIAISACLLALVYHFAVGRESSWIWRRAVPAFWFGAAMAAKASGLVFGPVCLFAVELERLHRQGVLGQIYQGHLLPSLYEAWVQLRPFRRDFCWIFGGGMAVLFIYTGCDWQAEPSFVKWANNLPEGSLKTVMVPIAENLCIFSNAGEGLIQQVKHNVRGHGTYLLGKTYRRACWHYFWILPTIKLSLTLLFLPIVLLLLRPKALLNWAVMPAALLFALCPLFRVQIGIRLILPFLSLFVIGFAAAAVQVVRMLAPTWAKATLVALLALGVGWSAASSYRACPNTLCYINELWGGTPNGYQLVSDTDYDWGQGLKELAEWQKTNGISSLKVWYFGTDSALHTMPVEEVRLHMLPIQDESDVAQAVGNGYFAASTTLLYGGYCNSPAAKTSVEFLRACKPVARTTTFFIYDFRNRQ